MGEPEGLMEVIQEEVGRLAGLRHWPTEWEQAEISNEVDTKYPGLSLETAKSLFSLRCLQWALDAWGTELLRPSQRSGQRW